MQVFVVDSNMSDGAQGSGLVIKLADELNYSSQRPPGYPDSDDELDADDVKDAVAAKSE